MFTPLAQYKVDTACVSKKNLSGTVTVGFWEMNSMI